MAFGAVESGFFKPFVLPVRWYGAEQQQGSMSMNLCRDDRQREEKRGAMVQSAVHAHASAVIKDDVLHNCQSQPSTPTFAGARFVYAVKALKDTAMVLSGDARAKIADVEFDRAFPHIGAQHNAASCCCVLNGVVNQIR